jgi:hypothetical protein
MMGFAALYPSYELCGIFPYSPEPYVGGLEYRA